MLEERVDTVMKDTDLAIEARDLAASLEALEAVLKTRKNGEAKP